MYLHKSIFKGFFHIIMLWMGNVWRLSISVNRHIENFCRKENYIFNRFLNIAVHGSNIRLYLYDEWSVDLTNVLKLWIVASNSNSSFICVVANSMNTWSTFNLLPYTSKLSNLIFSAVVIKDTFYSTTLTWFVAARRYKKITTTTDTNICYLQSHC